MPHFPVDQLSPWQQTILDVVRRYPGQFTRSGLAKMLVGARSWQDTSFAEYGRFASQRRKDVDYLVDILLQQEHIQLDGNNRLIPVTPPDGVTRIP
ncbi:MAG: hypothetical protein IPM39_27410 [Chloroflexi bacterium]|nr:hypothetical protein [Chloroflexota bacterium]